MRRSGWAPDGRQKVRCNDCEKERALPLGEVAVKRSVDTLGRPIQYGDFEHEYQLPDPEEEAIACFMLARFENSFEETRELILVTSAEVAELAWMCRYQLFDTQRVEAVLDFRAEVLVLYDRLVRSYRKNREEISTKIEFSHARECGEAS